MHNSKRIVAGVLLIGILILGGCGQQGTQRGSSQIGPPEVAVVTIQPRRLVITTELTGRTSARLIAEVRPQVSGIIQKRLFKEGSDVKAGDILYRIDPAPFQAAYDNAAANLAATRKAADRARAALKASLADLSGKKAALDFARTNRDRMEELLKEGAVSAGQRDQAVAEADVAGAALIAAEAQVESNRQAVAAAEAAIDQAEAALKISRINLEYTGVTAPISGRIGKSSVTEGAIVTAYQPLGLATIQQLDPMYVDVTQSTAELLRLRRRLEDGRLHQGGENLNRVRLRLEDGSNYPWEGALQFRDVSVDKTTGTVILRIIFPNPNGILLPGMFVRAVVDEGINPKAVLVPQQAVSRTPKGEPLVLIVDAAGKVQQKMIKLDRAIGNEWLVSAGLSFGDDIIVEGTQKVKPGVFVKAVPFEAGGKNGGRPEKTTPSGKSN